MSKKYLLITVLFAAILNTCGKSSESHSTKNVFGPDSRQSLNLLALPGKALGRLDGGCSAVMVGKSLALTAAHCVYDTETKALRKDVKNLKVGVSGGTASKTSWISSVWLGTTLPVKERANDWALLKLEKPLGDQTGWVGVSSQSILDSLPYTVNLAGYATDKEGGDTPYLQKSCYILKQDDEGRLLHECDTSTGSSGSPMFINTKDGPYVVAINVAEFRTGSNSLKRESYSHKFANIAVEATRFHSVLGQLRSTVDVGEKAERVSGAHYFNNTNSSDEITKKNSYQANNGNSRDNKWQAVEKGSQVTTRYNALNQEAVSLYNKAISMRDYAQRARYMNLYNVLTPLIAEAHHVATTSYNLSMGKVSETTGFNLLRSQAGQLQFRYYELMRIFDLYSRARSSVVVELRANVAYITERTQNIASQLNRLASQ